MAGVAKRQFSGIAVENAEEQSDEPVRRAIGGRDAVQARHHFRQALRLFDQHLHARLQAHHQQGSGHAFAGDIAQHHGDAAASVGEEIVVIAADGAARGVVPGHIESADGRRHGRQKALLDFGGLLEIARHQLPRLFHFGEARLLDPDGGDIRHHRQQVQIVFRELAQQGRRIDIDDADDLVARLQRNRHQGADILFDDAAALAERVVDGRVAHQHGEAAVRARGRARRSLMRKPSP